MTTPRTRSGRGAAQDAGKPSATFEFGEKEPNGLWKDAVYLKHMKNYLAITHMSVLVAVSTLSLIAVWHYVTYRACAGGPPALPIQIALGIAYGFISMRCFMVLHDCGHGSFFRSEWANTACGYVFSVFAGTPTDFGPTHALHHDNVGNMDQDTYDWAETVFHTLEQFKAMPVWKQRLWRFFRHPVVFFMLAPFGLWWVKFRIPMYTGKRRTGTYRPWNKLVNTACVLVHFYLAVHFSGWTFARIMFFGGLFGATMGMMLFHMQHVHNPGYQVHGNWNRIAAAIHGSSYLHVPEWAKFFTMGIEYHHIHHMFTKVPGYRLRECHEEAPEGLWEGITRLGYRDMWESLCCTVYDEKKGCYSPYP